MSDPSNQEDYFLCEHCGAELPADATFCRHCGASDESGWQTSSDDDDGAGGYADDDDFDYEEFVQREFPEHAAAASAIPWRRVVITAIALALCAALLAWTIWP